MPVLIDSAASDYVTVADADASKLLSVPSNVNPLVDDHAVVAALLYSGTGDISAAALTAQFGGLDMAVLKTVLFNSNNNMLRVFTLLNPPEGPQSLAGSLASNPGAAGVGTLLGSVITLSGVDSFASADAVAATPTNTLNSSVTVASIAAAHRVVTVHAMRSINNLNYFTGYNKTQRTQVRRTVNAAASLLIGDAPGDASVTCTATMKVSSSLWSAVGVAVLPSVVVGNAELIVPQAVIEVAGGIVRDQPPSPERTWILEAKETQRSKRWKLNTDEQLDFTVDWSNKLVDGDYVVAATFAPAAGLSELSKNFDATTSTIWLTGPAVGQDYSVPCRVTTHAGRLMDATFRITGTAK